MINKKIGVLLLLMVLFSMENPIHGLSYLITQQVRWIYEDAS